MMGLIIVIGMLVDDAVVVTENAQRLMESGIPPKEAGVLGTQQIWAPVTASVMTTVVVFLPLMFMSGIIGKFVRHIPYAVVLGLIISLLECFFILPHHIGIWIKQNNGNGSEKKEKFLPRYWSKHFIPFYIEKIRFLIGKRWIVVGVVTVLFASTILLAVKGMRFVLFPPGGIEIVFIRVETPIGSTLQTTANIMKPIEKIVAQLPKSELKNYVTHLGVIQQDPNDPFTKRGSEYAQIVVNLTPAQSRSMNSNEVVEWLRENVGRPKGVRKITFSQVNPGPPVGAPISIGIRGDTYEKILKGTAAIEKQLSNIKGVSDIQNNYVLGKNELRVIVNEREAVAAGLSVAQIGTSVRASFEGLIATTIKKLDEEIEVRVSLSEASQINNTSLNNLSIPNQSGFLIPLSRVSRIEKSQGLAAYEHENNQRQVRISGNVDNENITSRNANLIIKNYASEFKKMFPDLSLHFGGEDFDTSESMQSLGIAFLISIIGILMILVLLFKNIFQPLLVVFGTVPLGLMAVVWTFFIHGKPLSFMAMLGIVALTGVIVNNSIVFIDFVNKGRANGLDKLESILEAGKNRARPIFLTSLTTVCGILPTAYGIGGLDDFVVPVALALGWGILFGALLTMFIFPIGIAITDDLRYLLSKERKAKNQLANGNL